MSNQKLNHTNVVIMRAQLPHLAHKMLINTGLDGAEHVIVVLGSSYRSRDARNPFNWLERKAMITAMLGAEAERVTFVPVRDYYDDDRWARTVLAEVTKRVPHGAKIGIVGYRKDATSTYLNRFPQWVDTPVKPMANLDSTGLRKVYFESDDLRSALTVLEPKVDVNVLNYLQAWSALPEYDFCRKESIAVTAYRKKWNAPTYLTADAMVICNDSVLMVKRGGLEHIGHDQWALPGGFVNPGERFFEASVRELAEETSYKPLVSTLQSAHRGEKMFDHPLRSPRGRLISQLNIFELGHGGSNPEVKGRDDAKEAKWIPIADLLAMEEEIFEDHMGMLDYKLALYPKI